MSCFHKSCLYLSLIAITFLNSTNILAANDYFGEVNLQVSQFRYDIKPNVLGLTDIEGSAYLVSAAINFDSVKTDNRPYGEARFLQHVGEARFYSTKTTLDETYDGMGFTLDGELEFASTGLSVEYMSADHPVYASLDYNQGSIESSSDTVLGPSKNTDDFTDSKLGLGFFITDVWLVGLNRYQSKTNSDFGDSDETGNGLFIKYIWEMNDQSAINAEVIYAAFEEDDDFFGTTKTTQSGVLLDYYFANNASVGVSASDSKSNNDMGGVRIYGADFEYFFSPNIGAGVFYSTFKLDDNLVTDQIDTYGVNLTARF